MDCYGRGIWAGSLRHHKGRFYVFFGTPDEGFFMTLAPAAEGPWEPLTPLLAEKGWDDCSAIWGERDSGWFVETCFADGYKTYLFHMAVDGRSIDRGSARLVNQGIHREASKLLYHDGYYYLILSENRDGIGRYVMARCDKRITGTFSEERQLLLPCREANEPNQGGIVEGPDGRWYFLTHHGTGDWRGRIVSLLPVEWREGWPMMGDTSGISLAGQPGTMLWQAAHACPDGGAGRLAAGRRFRHLGLVGLLAMELSAAGRQVQLDGTSRMASLARLSSLGRRPFAEGG